MILHNISRGFNYWKDDAIRFASHEVFSFYQEAIQVITKLAKQCGDIKEMLSKQHLGNKKKTGNAYYKDVSQYAIFKNAAN